MVSIAVVLVEEFSEESVAVSTQFNTAARTRTETVRVSEMGVMMSCLHNGMTLNIDFFYASQALVA